MAQVEVDFPSISGSPGQTVNIPITLCNVESTTGFNSFQFDVTPSSADVVFKGATKVGTMLESNGWFFAANSVANGNSNNRVLGSGSTPQTVVASGIIAILEFEIVNIADGVTVSLVDFRLKKGADTVPITPLVPSTGLNASNSPVATDDSYTVNEGAMAVVTPLLGVLANDTDADGDPLTATLGTSVSNGTLTFSTDGSFTYLHDGSETTSDSFTYSVSDGSTTDVGSVSITVTPVNDAPVFTAEINDTTVDEGALVVGDYNATDAEGDALTFALVAGPTGAAVNPVSGEFGYLAGAGTAGVHTVTVSVSDGTATTLSSFQLTIRSVDRYAGTLSGIHQSTVVASSGTGSISVEYVSTTQDLALSGSFTGLSSAMVSAQLMVGAFNSDGTGILNLTAALDGTGTAGTFSAASNTFNLGVFTFPAGWNSGLFLQALQDGEVYVNIRSVNTLTGELRTQLLPDANTAPPAVNVSGPISVDISGNPTDPAFDLTWTTPGLDPNSNPTKLVLETASDVLFTSVARVADVSVTTGSKVTFSTADAAGLFDELTGATPGNTNVGGSVSAFYRLRNTDGAAIASGSPIVVTLVRGMVTDVDGFSELPTEFVLRGNYPNPFNPSTTISFDLPHSGDVQVDVLDLLGRTMLSIPSQNMSAGVKRSISLDASALSSGIYMYRVIAVTALETHVSTGTMTLIK